ncbi:MAG: hypothetical protein AVDCRST_MAG30-1332 [uncultured Solirubrobacteraceae bacterium]|uniref:Uncharacterized protein n=1 Tax=uncultured Solirubrobacteraceae bacterium TaxID=1162706 RepID=A0A6J4S5X2_9ACTN|nr:MAG: hypothetical protein AVDCRST_MAG30-1332 [uncultured Solirubrobacteraceae bacterium]
MRSAALKHYAILAGAPQGPVESCWPRLAGARNTDTPSGV